MPPCASTNSPRRSLRRAREGAARVAEELALEQIGSGSAAQLTATNGRSARGPPAWMARATTSLPVPGLARDQHRRRGVGDLLDQRAQLAHGRALAEELPRRRALPQHPAQQRVLRGQRPLAPGPLDQRAQRLQLERLGDVVERAPAHRLDRAVDRAERGHDDDRDGRVDLA